MRQQTFSAHFVHSLLILSVGASASAVLSVTSRHLPSFEDPDLGAVV